MSYENDNDYELPPMQESRNRRPGNRNPIFLFVVIVCVLVFFNGLKTPPEGNGTNGENGRNEKVEPSPRRQFGDSVSEKKAVSSDWEMEEMDAVESEQPKTANTRRKNSRTVEGDWSMEEVDSTNSQTSPGIEPQIKTKSKKTKKGDWELEEVGGG